MIKHGAQGYKDPPKAHQTIKSLGNSHLRATGGLWPHTYSFWTFLFERLNKVPKSYSTNNHSDGKIEISFFHAFLHDTELQTMVIILVFTLLMYVHDHLQLTNLLTRMSEFDELPSAKDAILYEAVKSIIATDSDTCGTVASLASEIDNIAQQGIFHSCPTFIC